MPYLLQRLSEPSTYAGLAAILAASGAAVPAGYVHDATVIGVVLSGVAAVVIKEGWRKALASGDAATAVENAVAETAKPTPAALAAPTA